MNFIRRRINVINVCFALIQFILLAIILFVDFDEDVVCFITVCLAFLHCALYVVAKKKGYLYLLAMFFTVVSDVFLVLRYNKTGAYIDQAIAMTTFSISQLCYFAFLFFLTKSKTLRIVHLIVRVGLSVLAVVLTKVVLKQNANYMIFATMFYFANLVTNAIFAFAELKRHWLMAVGLVFFILCDIIIGLTVAIDGGIITILETSVIYKIVYVDFNIAWLFYVISQTALSLFISRKPIRDFD